MYCPKCGSPNEDHAKFCQRCGEVLEGQSYEYQTASNRFAGFWIRFVAYIIDSLVLAIPTYLIELILGRSGSIGALIIDWVYFALMESSSKQATLGKMALGLKVVDANGNRLSFGRATGRYFSKIVSALILCIGYMMAGWNKEKRALHDFMAGTFVLKRNDY